MHENAPARPCSPGVYALPKVGANRHIPACEAVITLLLTTPDNQASAAELVAGTGLTRCNAAYGMVEKGVLVRPRRGVFALSPDTLRKIRRGEALKIGHSVLELPQNGAERPRASMSDA
jgi:hypothetical protein